LSCLHRCNEFVSNYGSVRDLAGRAKAKKLLPTEMEGSTFTVSNLGMFGIVDSIHHQPT
jgi:pyruvate dehydrogenase E2 component (dihydrolipoamide acetyltransferase)